MKFKRTSKAEPEPQPDTSPRVWWVIQETTQSGWRGNLFMATSEEDAIAQAGAEFARLVPYEGQEKTMWTRPSAFDVTQRAVGCVAALKAETGDA